MRPSAFWARWQPAGTRRRNAATSAAPPTRLKPCAPSPSNGSPSTSTPKRKPRTAANYRWLLDHIILPAIGTKKIAELARADVAKLHYAHRATPYAANGGIKVLRTLCDWAEEHGFRPEGSNPARRIEKYKEHPRERFLSPRELQRLGRALDRAERCGAITPWAAGAVRLLIFTGARRNEVLEARWEWVNVERGTLSLPDLKTGGKTIHLNAPALNVLAGLPRLDGNPFIICGGKPGARLGDLEAPWRRVRKAALLEDVRLHDLRHSFASIAVAGGMSLPLIGGLLGHSSRRRRRVMPIWRPIR